MPFMSEQKSFISFSSILYSGIDPDSPILFNENDPEIAFLAATNAANCILRPPVPVLDNICTYLTVCLHGAARRVADEYMSALIDSGANCHILTYEAAMKLLRDQSESNLRVIGVNGDSTAADVQGRLLVKLKGSSGREYLLDLGTAHGMKNCPVNLLSLSMLLDVGAVLHFEKGNCWIQPPTSLQGAGVAERIPMEEKGGLFEIPLHRLYEEQQRNPASAKFVSWKLDNPSKMGFLTEKTGSL